jgi:hypothetical protein
MHTKDTSPYYGSCRQKFESLSNSLEKLYAKLLLNLIVKAVYFVKVTALMIPPKQKEIEGIFDFQSHQ